MIFASSSADHLDCFFAGDSEARVESLSASRFEGITDGVDVAVRALDELDKAAMLEGAESERVSDGGGEGLDIDDGECSSSLGLRSREISTVDEWCQDWPAG